MFSIVDFAFFVQKKAVRGKVAGLFALMQEWVQRLTSLLNHKKLLFRGFVKYSRTGTSKPVAYTCSLCQANIGVMIRCWIL